MTISRLGSVAVLIAALAFAPNAHSSARSTDIFKEYEARKKEFTNLIRTVDRLAVREDLEAIRAYLHSDYLEELSRIRFEPPDAFFGNYLSSKKIEVLQAVGHRYPKSFFWECIVRYARGEGTANYYVVYIFETADGYKFRTFPMLPHSSFVRYDTY